MKDTRLRVEELALSLGVSVKTINNWYQFKFAYPDNEYAKMIPKYNQDHVRGTRYWDRSAIWQLKEFQKNFPRGRAGVMGKVTQKYLHKEEKNNGKKNTKCYPAGADEK